MTSGKRVDSELRNKWLKRLDEGETPPKIADNDGYDVRTVRKQISIAKQERERHEARSHVLRNALEGHYKDLVAFAGRIELNLDGSLHSISSEKLDQEPMWAALKEHIPRSSIWKGLAQHERIVQDLRVLIDKGAHEMVAWLQSEGITATMERSVNEKDLFSHFKRQLRERARGEAPQNKDIESTPTSDDRVILSHGSFQMFIVPSEKADSTLEVMKQIDFKISTLPQTNEINQLSSRLKSIADKIRQELTVIKYRRIVPGQCRYCPI